MKKRIWMFVTLMVIIVSISAFFLLKNDNNALSVFFFKTEDEKYILFDKNGKKLSNVEYDNVLDYIMSSTLVYKDSKISILDKKGNVLVDDSKYDDIVRYAAFYKANKDDKVYLLDNNGQLVKEITDSKIVSYKGAEKYIIVETENNYEIILYNGKKIYEFKRIDDTLPTVNQLDNLASIFYDRKTIIFDVNNGKVLQEIDTEMHYCINGTADNLLILNSCTNIFQDNINYKIIKNNEVLDFVDKCDVISLMGDTILCEYDNKKYLLDDDLEKSLEIDSSINYINDKNYIKEVGKRIDFYKNGKKVKSINNSKIKTIGYQNDFYYLLNTDNKYYYYDKSGDRIIEEGFSSATLFDNNSLALVTIEDKEVLIDRKGNKKCSEMDNIIIYSDFYLVSNDKIGLLDKDGSKILELEYDDINLLADDDHNYAILTKENEYIMYDIDSKKVIGSYDSEIINYNSYYKVGKKYYTYSGVEIYEEK